MTTLGLINGGHGDCFILRPSPCSLRPGKCWNCTKNCWSGLETCCFCPEECQYRYATFMIDMGDGNVDITTHLAKEDKLHLILTQSHRDYSKSMAQFLPSIMKDSPLPPIQSVTLPCHQNEIIFIAESITNLIGINYIDPCTPSLNYLKGLTSWQKILKRTFDTSSARYDASAVHWAYEGYKPCNHIIYKNPPLRFSNQESSAVLFEKLEEVSLLFSPGFSGQFRDYYTIFTDKTYLQKMRYDPEKYPFKDTLPPFVAQHFIMGNISNYILSRFYSLQKSKVRFVLNFFHNNLSLFQKFIAQPSPAILSAIVAELRATSQKNSLVMRYENDYEIDFATNRNKTFFFSSDADRSVLERIVSAPEVNESYYFALPNHGCQNNITQDILKKINPAVAIISHNNQHLAQQDTCPNQHVLTLLEQENIPIAATNDIVKEAKIIHSVENNYFDDTLYLLP